MVRCCAGDEGRPFGVALQGEASNHLMLHWLKTVVVSDEEKAHVMRQVGTGKASGSEPLLKRRNNLDGIKTGESMSSRDEPGGCLLIGQVVSGVTGGASPVHGSGMELGKAGVDTTVAGLFPVGVRGSALDGGSRRR
jgi:hypothetical protein